MRVLIVEDDPELAGLLRDGLREHRIDPTLAAGFAEGRDQALAGDYDVVILDVRLPGGTGYDLCADLRRQNVGVPVLMLTALDAVDDRVRGLAAGADDYLTKPFAFRELVARLQALTRRRALALTPSTLRVADLEVDLGSRQVRRADRPVDLTAKEFALLELLLLLGAGLFVAIGTQVSRRIDVSLAAATAAIEHATHDLEAERAAGGAADAVEELHIPDRDLYLFDANGRPITPQAADAWIIAAARAATATGTNDALMMANGQQSRLHAQRFTGRSGTAYVAVAVGQRPNIREQYAGLIGIFSAAALAALVMVALGGFLLARQSTVPVERSMEQMRRFMADAAHELRTPVTILRTRTEVALSQPRDATGDTAAFQAIERETERLGGIVGDLLTLARADSGERQAGQRPRHLDDVVSPAVRP